MNEAVWQEYLDRSFRFGIKVLLALLIFFAGLKIINLVRRIIKKFMKKVKADQGVIQFTDSFVNVALIIFLVLQIGIHFGLNVTSVATIIGSAGVTIGLALQGSLTNFVGGILLLLLKPFKVGDYIVEDTNKNEGTVEEITLFYTKLSTLDGRLVILPNGILSNASLTNVTGHAYRRLDLSFSIAYDADMEKAKDLLMKLMNEDDRIEHDKDQIVFVKELADSAVILGIRCVIKQENYWAVRWSLLEKAKLCFDENGIEIPYNHLDVKICNLS